MITIYPKNIKCCTDINYILILNYKDILIGGKVCQINGRQNWYVLVMCVSAIDV